MITLSDIQAARERIEDAVYLSPCAYSERLSQATGCEIYLKLENLQMTGSFKERGALNKIRQLSEEQKAAGVIAASAGNHAQAVAHAAKLSGIKAVIVMPETTPMTKIRGTQEFGAEIVLHGGGYDAAYEKACELQARHGYTLVHAFDDPAVIAGQGTIGLELLEQVPDLDAVLVPVGGGGLIAGIATAMKTLQPEVRVIGVETDRMAAMKKSVAAGHVQPLRAGNTIADGIAVARVGELTLPIVSRQVAEIVTVSEEEIANAILILLEREKTLAEGAGAVGFAAMCNRRVAGLQGKKVAVLISGGNIDMTMLSRILERGLVADDRLVRLTVVMADKPDSVARLAALVAGHKANILEAVQNRATTDVELGEAEVELTLETRGREHLAAIKHAIAAHGFHIRQDGE